MSRLMGMTGFGFIGLYALFTRAFTSLTDISIDYRVILASSCCVALIVVAVAMRGVRRHAVALSFVASLVVLAAFVVQSTLFLGMAESGAVWAVLLSSALMGFGYALYWPLWVIALERRSPSEVIRCVVVGSTVGVVVSSVPLLLPASCPGNEVVYSVLRCAMLVFSEFCLYNELKKADLGTDGHASQVDSAGAFGHHYRRFVASGETPSTDWHLIFLRHILFPLFVYVIVWFVLYSGHYHREANADAGTWIVVVSSVAICALLVVLSHGENESPRFLDLLGDVLLLLGLSLNLLFVVSAKSDELYWTGSLFSNQLIDVVIMAKMASLLFYCGVRPERIACFVLASRELSALLGMGVREVGNSDATAIANTLLVIVVLISSAVFIARKTFNTIKEIVSDSNREARSFAYESRMAHGLTEREADVLVELLDGVTYRKISQMLCISESTVKTHANHIYEKLSVESRDDLIDLYKSFRSTRKLGQEAI